MLAEVSDHVRPTNAMGRELRRMHARRPAVLPRSADHPRCLRPPRTSGIVSARRAPVQRGRTGARDLHDLRRTREADDDLRRRTHPDCPDRRSGRCSTRACPARPGPRDARARRSRPRHRSYEIRRREIALECLDLRPILVQIPFQHQKVEGGGIGDVWRRLDLEVGLGLL